MGQCIGQDAWFFSYIVMVVILEFYMCQVVDIAPDNLEADTSSYHCRYVAVVEWNLMNGTADSFCMHALWFMCLHLYSVVRDLALEQIDPSLAIGFYCRDKGEPL